MAIPVPCHWKITIATKSGLDVEEAGRISVDVVQAKGRSAKNVAGKKYADGVNTVAVPVANYRPRSRRRAEQDRDIGRAR